jgi:hypothetical protein
MMSSFDEDLERQTFKAPVITGQARNQILSIPEVTTDGLTTRTLLCTCGRTFRRSSGTRAIECGSCGRQYVWGEIQGDEQFLVS